ncbi:hypothetical protein [Kocuria rosea]|uniref:Uncharacterized protein n=1 Tax=Kocuria rosea subsp. polaris TaxID=136273 RepID=A0A0W8I1T5_KOCRO|nr:MULTISPECIES: hypothetical protein [Kocuria]KUG51696.1 hypothetical protein AVL61_15750 [Kocuria polaris]THE19232.1 hypothetical protein E1J17_02120 [Kocuria rosea]
MSDDPHAREQALYGLLARDHYNLHDMGEQPDLYPALKRLAIVLGDQQPEYIWATVTSNEWTAEAGVLHVLVGNAMLSTGYGRSGSREIHVEPLNLVDFDLDVRATERTSRVPGGVHKVTVTLNRDNGRDAMTIKAQTLQDDESVQALLALVRSLADRLS